MKNFLPSRWVIAFVLVPAVTIFGLWVIFSTDFSSLGKTAIKTDPFEQVLVEGQASIQQIDTDNDGLRDWEETLYGTDPDVADTDGDGVGDGTEVRSGRDPLISGDEIKDEIAQAESSFVFYKDDPDLSRTDVLARDIFSTYSQLKSSEAFGTDIAERAIDETITENVILQSPQPYALTDVTTVSDNAGTKAAYRAVYIEATRSLRVISFHELELLARFVELGEQEAYNELISNRDAYRNFLESMVAVSAVPEEIAAVHVELLNNMASLLFSLEQMLLIEGDPLSVLLYSEKYTRDEQVLQTTTQALSLYFTTD